MLQIIKRKEGEQSIKETITGTKAQIAYNDWGHLTVRIIKDDTEDILVVFDKSTSHKIIKFANVTIKEIDEYPDLPF